MRTRLRTEGTVNCSALGPKISTAAFSAIRINPSDATICIGTFTRRRRKTARSKATPKIASVSIVRIDGDRVAADHMHKKHIAHIAAGGEDDAVGEVQHFHDAKNQHQAERDQNVDRPHHRSIGDLLDERGQRDVHAGANQRRSADFISAGKSILRLPSLHHWVM